MCCGEKFLNRTLDTSWLLDPNQNGERKGLKQVILHLHGITGGSMKHVNCTTLSLVFVAAGVVSYVKFRKNGSVLGDFRKLKSELFDMTWSKIIIQSKHLMDLINHYIMEKIFGSKERKDTTVDPMNEELEGESPKLLENQDQELEVGEKHEQDPVVPVPQDDQKQQQQQQVDMEKEEMKRGSPFLDLVERIPGINQTWTFISSLDFENPMKHRSETPVDISKEDVVVAQQQEIVQQEEQDSPREVPTPPVMVALDSTEEADLVAFQLEEQHNWFSSWLPKKTKHSHVAQDRHMVTQEIAELLEEEVEEEIEEDGNTTDGDENHVQEQVFLHEQEKMKPVDVQKEGWFSYFGSRKKQQQQQSQLEVEEIHLEEEEIEDKENATNVDNKIKPDAENADTHTASWFSKLPYKAFMKPVE